jgi:transaldolase/glucose-6-phosphate isomerase
MTEEVRALWASSPGDFADNIEEAIATLDRENVVARIWDRDHTVWRPEPDEIADRLGWLTLASDMREFLGGFTQLAHEVKDSFFKHVVLLGMGGSSLGPEVIRQTLGSGDGFPRLLVLDSTAPSAIRAVDRAIDPARTLFVVSSKSGGTVEPNSFYKHFRARVIEAVGEDATGTHFVAVTDPGTSLATLGDEDNFRRVFEAPSDIGGRYSVLSPFGLVPAVLAGVNIERLLDRAQAVVERSTADTPTAENPAAWLGAFMAATALGGRDKLTLITSPLLARFGLWVEQLIAESTGKEGRGIVPIAGEPIADAEAYGDDRAFVYLRVEGDQNADVDVLTERLAGAGHPLVRFDIDDAYDLGAEFFRWEFATAVAGALLNIQPFDQPNVQAAKDATGRVLEQYKETGELPAPVAVGQIADLLGQAETGDYFAIMAYAQETPGVDSAVGVLRKKVMERHKIATTFGYGPRFLHSTGQLPKGGPNSGLFLQLTVDDEELEIPSEPFGFRTLISAQAMGDHQALVEGQRRVVRVHLGEDAEAGLLRLLGGI